MFILLDELIGQHHPGFGDNGVPQTFVGNYTFYLVVLKSHFRVFRVITCVYPLSFGVLEVPDEDDFSAAFLLEHSKCLAVITYLKTRAFPQFLSPL